MYACIYIYIQNEKKNTRLVDWVGSETNHWILFHDKLKKRQIAWCRMYKTYGSNSTNFIYLSFYLECSLKKVVNVIESIKLSPDFFFFFNSRCLHKAIELLLFVLILLLLLLTVYIHIYQLNSMVRARAHACICVKWHLSVRINRKSN